MNEQLKKLLPELTEHEIGVLYDRYPHLYFADCDESITREKFMEMLFDLLVEERCVKDAGDVFVKCVICKCLYEKTSDNSGNESDKIAMWYYMSCPKCHSVILVSRGANIEREKKWNE